MENKITQATFIDWVASRSFPWTRKILPADAPERMGRNPATGVDVAIPAKRTLKFKMSSTVDLSK